ncbi:MAG: DMT family transporter [Hyphomicrobiaceae bacterium]
MATIVASGEAEARWTTRDLLFMVAIQLIWGANWVAAKIGVAEVPPLMLMAARFAMLVFVFMPFMRWHGRGMWEIAVAALTNGAIHFGLLFWGLSLGGDIAPLAVVGQLGVPFATLMSALFLGDRIGVWRGGALALAFGGSMVVSFDPRVLGYIHAVGLVILASSCWAIGAIYMRRLKHLSVFDMQGWIAALAFPPLIVFSFAIEKDPFGSLMHASWPALLALGYIAFGSSLIGHVGFNYMLQRYPIPKMAPFLLIAPLFASFLGVVVFGDQLTWRMVIGGAMTLTGVLVITIREGRRSQRAVATGRTDSQSREAGG